MVNAYGEPLINATSAVGAYAHENPRATRFIEIAAQGAYYAVAGPAAIIKDQVIDRVIGKQIEAGTEYLHGKISGFYQENGVKVNQSNALASGTIFAGSLVLGAVAKGVQAAKKFFTKDIMGPAHNAAEFERLKERYRSQDPKIIDTRNFSNVYGSSASELMDRFRLAGYDGFYSQTKKSSDSDVYTLEGHPDIAKFQAGRSKSHGGFYYKFTMHSGRETKVLDTSLFGTPGTVKPGTVFLDQSGNQVKYYNDNWHLVNWKGIAHECG